MSGSVNKVILVGNLGREPEARYMQSGDKVVNLAIATSERWNDRQTGELREKTEWHRVVIFDQKLAEVAEKYLKKGTKVFLEGQLQTRKWTDQQGQERYTTEVVLPRFTGQLTILSARGEEGGRDFDPGLGRGERYGPSSGSESDAAGRGGRPPANDPMDLDDDIPF